MDLPKSLSLSRLTIPQLPKKALNFMESPSTWRQRLNQYVSNAKVQTVNFISLISAPTRLDLNSFKMQHQTQLNWCWAAVTASVHNYYNRNQSTTQCEVADKQLNKSYCCSDSSDRCCAYCNCPSDAQCSSDNSCNLEAKLSESLQKYGHFERLLDRKDD